ncbi:hypothetical protein KK083_03320 [Fulvivirgaceae bacterium PWU4]|uniref:MoxR-vWA-beta-propeller ternary system domain-containing protein n=1 Tax=Chryseosolibacter histidini TaxID=2782349 RepID=A0AAP2DIA7_9BACT|nr:hypothetical protein [Chryseosolibacter histidini]MBT1695893.1 hypothetical protein [Chryseosolibacter histidini]
MKARDNNYFDKMIRHLRQHEEVMLYGNLLNITAEEADDVVDFLKEEYEREALNHPYEVPLYNPVASRWAAQTVYISAQLMLFRENKPEDLGLLLPAFPFERDAAAMLSADLCLRFLPVMITHLKLIDSDDPLIALLETRLEQWHYSGVAYALEVSKLDFTPVVSDPCLHALYCNRIIQHKKLALARHPAFETSIRAFLGIYGTQLWSEFTEAISPTLP